MKKKIIGIFVVMLFILSVIPLNTSSRTLIDNNESLTKSKILNFLKYPYMKNSPQLDPNGASPKPKIGNPPTEFSWKNDQGKDWTTPAKSQGELGTCWAFAAMAALESVINIREENAELDYNLSEQYILSCLPAAGGANSGGSAYQTYKFIMDTSPEGNLYNGIIPETCFPYQNKDGVPCSDKCNDWVDHLIPIHGYGYWCPDGSPEDRDRIKTQILEKGPVAAGMYSTKIFFFWGAFLHKSSYIFKSFRKTSEINHVVTLVGWKDDPKVMNGGYWIAKNSWGTEWGYDGFFNIAYGCLGIDKNSITWVEYDSAYIDSPPVADAGGPYSGAVGQDVFFNASNSFDSEGDIVSYEWDFGDGNQGRYETTTYSYSNSGVYVVNLTVTDESGKKDSDEITAIIDYWQVGDSWKFNANYYFDFTVTATIGKIPRFLTFSSNNFEIKVVGETDEDYLLELKGTGSGFIKLYLLKKPVKSITITGDMVIRKSDLGIKNYNITYDGKIGLLKIPINAKLDTEFNPIWQIFPFPFYSDKKGYLDHSNVKHNVSIEVGFVPATKYQYYYTQGPFEYICKEKVITVPAGTYSTFYIKNPPDPFKRFSFEYYYSPVVKNFVKFSITLNKYRIIKIKDRERPKITKQKYFMMDLELVSTN